MIAMALTTAYVGLGSNEGDRMATIFRALDMLDCRGDIIVGLVSQLIETTAQGGPDDQNDYLNGVVELRCTGLAEELLRSLQDIENRLGRERKEKWGPRTIDLDLLLFGVEIIDKPHLQVPHPLMHGRRFVMAGLCEIAPDFVHPVLGKTIGQIWEDLQR